MSLTDTAEYWWKKPKVARNTPEHLQECRKVFERDAVVALHTTFEGFALPL